MKKLYEKTTKYLDMKMGSGEQNIFTRQFKIDSREYELYDDELYDPIGDENYRKTTGLIHRYPDRVLLMPRDDCAVQCRFCFRKWKLPEGKKELDYNELDSAISYIKEDPEIWEVILTGGEPLLTNTDKLLYISKRLAAIDHVKILRIHTRLPIVDPGAIDPSLVNFFGSFDPMYIVLHCNHPDELTAEACNAIHKISDAGAVLLSQSALLKGVNADAETLESLFRKLVENKVKPYYLHHCDLVPGTRFYRTSIREGQNLLKRLRGYVSGVCWPTYVLDIPEGYGKVPIAPEYYRKDANGNTIVTDYKGVEHNYPDIDNNHNL